MNRFLLPIAGIAVLAAAPTLAQDSRAVPYRDLDLSSPQGLAVLHQRVRAAAHALCDQPGVRDLRSQASEAACRSQATQGTASQIAMAIESGQRLAMNAGAAKTVTR